jgi:hypothetical protein
MGDMAASTRHGEPEIGAVLAGLSGSAQEAGKARGGPERDGLVMRAYGVGVDCQSRFYQVCLRSKGQSMWGHTKRVAVPGLPHRCPRNSPGMCLAPLIRLSGRRG